MKISKNVLIAAGGLGLVAWIIHRAKGRGWDRMEGVDPAASKQTWAEDVLIDPNMPVNGFGGTVYIPWGQGKTITAVAGIRG